MKNAVISISCVLMLIALGCTSNDRSGAGREQTPHEPAAPAPPGAISASVGGSTAQAPGRSDPSANGGSSLTASTLYNGNGTTVSQNINPAPFLTANQAQGGHPSGAAVPPNPLTSRADGDMRGPNDQPAAGTGGATQSQLAGVQEQTATRPAPKGKRR